MNQEEAQRYLEILRAVPDSRHWSITVTYEQMDPKDEIRTHYSTALFINQDCFVGSGKTPMVAVIDVVRSSARDRVGLHAVNS